MRQIWTSFHRYSKAFHTHLANLKLLSLHCTPSTLTFYLPNLRVIFTTYFFSKMHDGVTQNNNTASTSSFFIQKQESKPFKYKTTFHLDYDEHPLSLSRVFSSRNSPVSLSTKLHHEIQTHTIIDPPHASYIITKSKSPNASEQQEQMVGLGRVEPPTSRLSGVRSNH